MKDTISINKIEKAYKLIKAIADIEDEDIHLEDNVKLRISIEKGKEEEHWLIVQSRGKDVYISLHNTHKNSREKRIPHERNIPSITGSLIREMINGLNGQDIPPRWW
jgi:hypothetical protein